MEWWVNNSSIFIAAGSLIVSIMALFRSNITASKTVKLQRTIQLSNYHDKVMLGRQAMETIFRNWATNNIKSIIECNEDDKNNFIAFYNENYHHGSDDSKKALSNEVHRYLSRLNHLWQDSQNNTFEIEEIMLRFGDGMCIDEQYTLLYLRAHQEAHSEQVFWQGIPLIIEASKNWQSQREEIT